MSNIVYILTNEAMPDLVKIGTTNTSIDQRMKELYNTSIPVPFECFYACTVADAQRVEKRLHQAFDKYRINNNREFFEISPGDVRAILELLAIENVTPREDYTETEEDRIAIERLEQKTNQFNLRLAGIPVGATLLFAKDHTVSCEVAADNKVVFNGKEQSLSRAALSALHTAGYEWKTARGAQHWEYQGETLLERWQRLINQE